MLGPTLDKCGAEPFATGGFSDVYEATLNGHLVAIKTLKVSTTTDSKKAHRVSGLASKTLESSLMLLDPKLLVKEVVGWKWLQHENILPFIGVTLTPQLFSIVSERMENGNVTDFIKAHPDHNRVHLVSGGVRLSSYNIDLLGSS